MTINGCGVSSPGNATPLELDRGGSCYCKFHFKLPHFRKCELLPNPITQGFCKNPDVDSLGMGLLNKFKGESEVQSAPRMAKCREKTLRKNAELSPGSSMSS